METTSNRPKVVSGGERHSINSRQNPTRPENYRDPTRTQDHGRLVDTGGWVCKAGRRYDHLASRLKPAWTVHMAIKRILTPRLKGPQGDRGGAVTLLHQTLRAMSL